MLRLASVQVPLLSMDRRAGTQCRSKYGCRQTCSIAKCTKRLASGLAKRTRGMWRWMMMRRRGRARMMLLPMLRGHTILSLRKQPGFSVTVDVGE